MSRLLQVVSPVGIGIFQRECGSSRRDVIVGAGKKKKHSPGGRIEGKRTPRNQDELDVPQEWIDRAIAEADVVYNDDYYKYGPYGPFRSRGLIHGEPLFGEVTDPDSLFLYTNVRCEEDIEEWDKQEQDRIFLKKLNMMDEKVGIHFYYVFVRSWRRKKWQLPWKEWTLAANVAVESAQALDKWEVGELVDLRARHGVTRCVSWCRPDLIWVKRPTYQVRYQPQEEYIGGLFQLLNPETELNGIAGSDVEEMKKQTYYHKLCEKLGVKVTASEREIQAAFDNLDDDSRSGVLEHMLFAQPVNLLHPFTQAWRRKEREAAAAGKQVNFSSVREEEAEEEDDFAEEDDEQSEESDEEEADDEVNEAEEEDYDEEQDEEVCASEDAGQKNDQATKPQKKWKDTYFGGKGNPLRRPNLETWQRDFYKAVVPTSAEIRRYPKELYFHHFDHLDNDSSDDENNWNFEPGTGLKAAVRPFTYKDMLQEIVYIRRQYACYQEEA